MEIERLYQTEQPIPRFEVKPTMLQEISLPVANHVVPFGIKNVDRPWDNESDRAACLDTSLAGPSLLAS